MASQLSNKARPALRGIIVENGRSLLRDRSRLNCLLRDFCPDCNYEIEALLAAVDDGVPQDLLAMGEPAQGQVAQLAGRLVSRRGLSQENAEWVVLAWVFALDLKIKAEPRQQVRVEPPSLKIEPALNKDPKVEAPAIQKTTVKEQPAQKTVRPAIVIPGDPWASENRAAGWKRLYVSILLLFFIGGGGFWAVANQNGSDGLGQVLFAVCGILGLAALTGLYKVITGR